MSESNSIASLIYFINNQNIRFTQVSKSLYRLPETQVHNIPATIFLKLDKQPELIINLLEPKYEKLPESVTQTIQKFFYFETGVFKANLKLKKGIPENLNEISKKVKKLFSEINNANGKTSEFENQLNSHQVKRINSIKNFKTNRFVYRVNKQQYMKLYKINQTYWLGDLILIVEPSMLNGNLNVSCMLENKNEMMELKRVENLNTFESFEQMFYNFDLNIHENFKINERIFKFFCDLGKYYQEFTISNKEVRRNGDLTISSWLENKVIRDNFITKEDIDMPKAILESISKNMHFNITSSALGEPD